MSLVHLTMLCSAQLQWKLQNAFGVRRSIGRMLVCVVHSASSSSSAVEMAHVGTPWAAAALAAAVVCRKLSVHVFLVYKVGGT